MHRFRNLVSTRYGVGRSKTFHINGISIEVVFDFKYEGGIRIIERGRGVVRHVVLYSEELVWIQKMCRKERELEDGIKQIGNLRGGARTLVCTRTRDVRGRKLEQRLFAPYGRSQVRIPELSPEKGWCFFSNILVEFIKSKDDTNEFQLDQCSWPSHSPASECPQEKINSTNARSYLQVATIPRWSLPSIRSSISGQGITVKYEDAVSNSQYMGRCLTGKLCGLEDRDWDLVSFTDWLNEKWRVPGGLDIKVLGGGRLLFSFPSKELADKYLEEKVVYKECPLLIDKAAKNQIGK